MVREAEAAVGERAGAEVELGGRGVGERVAEGEGVLVACRGEGGGGAGEEGWAGEEEGGGEGWWGGGRRWGGE